MYVIDDGCSGCHTCELLCPMGALYYDGPRYQIDSSKCVECGLCEQHCPAGVIHPDVVAEPEPHAPRVRECDLVVCGGGTGLISAVRAAQRGLKVILLEKARRVGGNTDFAHGFFPIYSKLHQEQGVPDVREEAVAEFVRRTDGVIGEDIMHTAVYGSSVAFDWLLDFPRARELFSLHVFGEKRAAGPIFGPAVIGFPHRFRNTRSTDPSIGPGWMGSYIREAMLAAIPEQKLDVEILLEHEATQLVLAEDGSIAAVVARDPGGVTEIRCNSVILATGGFGSSDEKLQRYAGFFDVDRPVTRFSVPTDTGDAIDMLAGLGIEPDPERMFISMFGPAHHPYSYSLYRLLDHPSCLSVDLDGVRWQDETGGLFMGRFNIAGHRQESQWGIFSQANVDEIFAAFIADPTLSDEVECYTGYQADLDREATYRRPPVVKADTLAELAARIGVDPAVLERTVGEYNDFCASGVDAQFGKTAEHLRPRESGPYYAIWGQRFSEAAMGGVTVDAHCRVLRNDGTPVPGLYGVGDATSAMHRKGELAVVSELTWAVASAYTSAENATSYLEGVL